MATNEAIPTTDDVVDTSTNDESQDTEVDDEAAFDEVDASFDDGTEETDESDEDTEEESEEDEGSQAQDEETEESRTPSDEEQRKRHNDEMARRRIAERETAKHKQQQDYLDDSESDDQRAVRQLQIDAYNNRIESNTTKLVTASDRSIADIDLFTKGTPEQKEALLDAVDEFQQIYVTFDRNGDPVEVRGDLYAFLQRKADSIRRLSLAGARTQAKQKANQKARTMPPTSRAPKPGKKDDMLDAFDEEANRW